MDLRRVVKDAHIKQILCVAINPSRKEIFTGSEDATIKVWEGESCKLVNTLEDHVASVTSLAFMYKIEFKS